MTIGIIPAPDLPAADAEAIKDDLPKALSTTIDDEIEWNVEIEVSPLTGAAEKVKDIMEEAKKLLDKNNWDYAICLTDLPIFSGKNVVLADANVADCVAQISLPAFGALPTPKRVKKTVVHMVKELHTRHMDKDNEQQMLQKGIGPLDKREQKGFFSKLKGAFLFSPIRRKSSPQDIDGIGVGVRFIIASRLIGLVHVLLGMAASNRPWTIMPSFKGVVALAFASGAYGLIFPTLWQLSVNYEIPRFIGLMIASILAMIIWIVFAHNLWERPKKDSSNHLRMLYNAATIITLTTSILMYYFVLFLLFLVAVSIFVPPDLYGAQTDQNIEVTHYIKLAWLVTSVATVAGSIGSGLEKTEEVGKITYGYRQYLRYEQMKQIEKKKEEEKYGKSENE